MSKILEVNKLTKSFLDRSVFTDLSFDVESGEFLSILGASGCGKTTLLRILIGIESPDSGQIIKNGKNITRTHPSQRGMGIVFQNFALFPNLTVFENILFPLKYTKGNSQENIKKTNEIIEKVGLSSFRDKRPHQLSGGQQQRVAIARTLIVNPKIMLFDEPMSALDASNRISLRKEFKKIQKDFNITMIYVTHDQEEAFAMSERIMVMNKGNIEQLDTPYNIYNNPKTGYVRSFVVEHLNEKIDSIVKNTGSNKDE